MPAVHIDQSQVVYEDVSCMDTDGETVETPAIVSRWSSPSTRLENGTPSTTLRLVPPRMPPTAGS